MQRFRVMFMGSAQISCPSLQGLIDDAQYEVIGVVTQPDRPKGRELKLKPTPVKELALKAGLPVLQPEKARNPEFVQQVQVARLDLIAVVAFGQILPKAILEAPRYGCVNVHTSLLPKYRGAGPIQWAILQDEPETGVTIMKMDEGLDTGAILSQERTPIVPQDDAQTLYDRLSILGARLLLETMPGFVSGSLTPVPQSATGASYAPKIKKYDGLIDWSQPARSIWNRVRGLVPWPGAFTQLPAAPKPHSLKIWKAEVAEDNATPGEILQADRTGIVVGTGQRSLRILELQREGGRRLKAQDFLTGHPLMPGIRLG